MNIFYQAYQDLKNDFFYYLLIKLLFTSLISSFLLFSFLYMNSFVQDILVIDNSLQDLGFLQDITEEQTSYLIEQISPIVAKFRLYLNFILPFGLLIIYLLIEPQIYRKILKIKNIFDKYFYWKFFIISLPLFILILLIYLQYLTVFGLAYYEPSSELLVNLTYLFIGSIVLFFIIGYYTTISYNMLDKPIKKAIIKSFSLGTKKIHIFIGIYLLIFLILIGYLFVTLNVIVAIYNQHIPKLFLSLIYLVVIIVILVYLKLLLKNKISSFIPDLSF